MQHLFFWKSYKKPIARNGDFRIYAHRGYTGEAPDNTNESIDAAIKKGYGWVEIDIVSTKDNVVVCSHNFDLEKETDGLGYIYNHNYDSLKCLNIRSYNNSKNYKIPKLVDVLNLYGHKINYNIEIKVKTDDLQNEEKEEELDDWDSNWTEDGECLNDELKEEVYIIVIDKLALNLWQC